VTIPGGEPVKQVAAGRDHSCALTTGGKVFCWGKNEFGQLGNGTVRNSSATPVAVKSGVTFRAISAGSTHTCALGTDNAAYCWGDNLSGAVGSTMYQAEPTPVDIDRGRYGFAQIVAGGNTTCALTAQGEAYCWGENRHGQAGVGNRDERIPIGRKAQRDVRFSNLMLGERHACGLSRSGESGDLFCWGDNALGQLGNGASADPRGLTVPTQVQAVERFVSIATGASHTCGVAQDGGVYCWGDNSRKQLAPLTDPKVALPTRLPGSSP
jgi:alpha-tubulin suppressor-like RCC1 family protein